MMIIFRRLVIGGLCIGLVLILWGFRLWLVFCILYGGVGLGRGVLWLVFFRFVFVFL